MPDLKIWLMRCALCWSDTYVHCTWLGRRSEALPCQVCRFHCCIFCIGLVTDLLRKYKTRKSSIGWVGQSNNVKWSTDRKEGLDRVPVWLENWWNWWRRTTHLSLFAWEPAVQCPYWLEVLVITLECSCHHQTCPELPDFPWFCFILVSGNTRRYNECPVVNTLHPTTKHWSLLFWNAWIAPGSAGGGSFEKSACNPS